VRPSAFEALSIRAAALEDARPRLYRALVVAYIWAGRLVLVASVVLALVVGALALLTPFTWAFAVLAGLFAWQVAQSLDVRRTRMRGVRLPRHHAPALHHALEEVAGKLGVRPVDDVYLTGELNAAVSEVPLLGELGVDRTQAQVGLALLHALTPDEARAVFAHELAHLAGGHPRFAARVASERERWTRLDRRLKERRHPLARVVAPFVAAYVSRLDALTQVLVRDHELEADRRSADVAGARVAADTLVRVAVMERVLAERHWAPILARSAESEEPVGEPHASLPAFLASLSQEDLEPEMRAALGTVAQPEDSHPDLVARLAAVGADARAPAPVIESAAQILLEPALQRRLAEVFDDHWRKSVARQWHERHARASRTASLLHALHARAAHGGLADDDLARRAALVFESEGAEAARPLVSVLRERHPAHGHGLLLAGRLQLEDGDAGGLAQLERALALDPRTTLGACGHAAEFLSRLGRREEAAEWLRRGRERAHAEDMAQQERERVPTSPQAYAGCGLAPHEEQILRERLGAVPTLRLSVLLRRRLEWLPEQPAWLLAAVRASWPFESAPEVSSQALVQALSRETCLPRPTWVVVLTAKERAFAEALALVPGALVVRERRWPLAR
jgi:Zn-dependent protease with chaperone function